MCVHNIFNPPFYCYCCYVVVDRHEMGMLPGYLLDVNPFDQPGVEAYKKNMFALLGKPGYEALRQELAEKLHRA